MNFTEKKTDLTSQQIYYTINYYNSLMRIEVKETMHKVGKNSDLIRKRKAAGISGERYGKVKKDLKDFQYDELIENHLYRTPQGQRIWLRLGFPYIVDQSPGKDS